MSDAQDIRSADLRNFSLNWLSRKWDVRVKRELALGRSVKMSNRRSQSVTGDSKLYSPVPRANLSGTSFNIVTHAYFDTPDGHRLRQHDELIRYRSQVRAAYLASKNHIGMDPIAGTVNTSLCFPQI